MRDNVTARNRLVHDSTMDWRPVLEQLLTHAERLRPWVRDVSLMLGEAMRDGQSILFEGAQGTLLDIDHGTYPYVTSSNASIGGVCTGSASGPAPSSGVLGVVKAYTTRVGEGPLPTELSGEMGNRLRESGNEYGAVTGRPRRCGWYDAVAVRYGVRINGLDALALTKLDVLDGLERIEICTSYRCGGRTLTEFPSDIGQLAACEPVYESMPGWSTPTKGVRRFDALPTRRGVTSRGWKRCQACRRRSSRPARSATTRSSEIADRETAHCRFQSRQIDAPRGSTGGQCRVYSGSSPISWTRSVRLIRRELCLLRTDVQRVHPAIRNPQSQFALCQSDLCNLSIDPPLCRARTRRRGMDSRPRTRCRRGSAGRCPAGSRTSPTRPIR